VAKQQVKATANISNSFEEAINFLSLSVVSLKIANHQVAALGSGTGDEYLVERAEEIMVEKRVLGILVEAVQDTLPAEEEAEVMAFGPITIPRKNGKVFHRINGTVYKKLDPSFQIRVVKVTEEKSQELRWVPKPMILHQP
jgi:hypothetical protein